MDKWESFPSIEESVKMDKTELHKLHNQIRAECYKINCQYLFCKKKQYHNIQEYWESAEEPTIEGCIEYLKEKTIIERAKFVEREEKRLYEDFMRLSKRKVNYGSGWEVNHNGRWRETCSNLNCLNVGPGAWCGIGTYYIDSHIKSRFPEFSGICSDCKQFNIPIA